MYRLVTLKDYWKPANFSTKVAIWHDQMKKIIAPPDDP